MNWTILKNEKEYQAALTRLDKIFDVPKNSIHFREAELLSLLIEKYENDHEPSFPEPDPIEALKLKMEELALKNKDLSEIVGGKSKASEILNRKRKLTLPMIRKINSSLGIDVEVLIKDYALDV